MAWETFTWRMAGERRRRRPDRARDWGPGGAALPAAGAAGAPGRRDPRRGGLVVTLLIGRSG